MLRVEANQRTGAGMKKDLHRSFPYQDQRDFEHLCDSMRKAGLPA
jgi:hypothetical protein